MASPFLDVPVAMWVAHNELAFAVEDRFPVSPGHTLVIPRRLVATWFEATAEERTALFELVDEVKRLLDERLHPDGYNIGINAGEAAGQTVMHLHVHVIPRFRGDVDDPRGGVRHVIPGKGNYLSKGPRRLVEGGREDPFFDHIAPLFGAASEVAILAAFVQESGLDRLEQSVFDALTRGARVRLITGDYLHITQAEALFDLLDWTSASSAAKALPAEASPDEAVTDARRTDAIGADPTNTDTTGTDTTDTDTTDTETTGTFEARVVEVASLDPASRSFHPKSWRFEGPGFGTAFVGSSNVSRSALGAGIEWNLRVDRHRDPAAYNAVLSAFEDWWSRARPLTQDWVRAYAERAREASTRLPPTESGLPLGEEEAAPIEAPHPPHAIQQEALAELRKCREEQHWGRALVVLATGLGKTYLAALDIAQWADTHGRWPRVLVLAHREELLFQAAKTFRRTFRNKRLRFGWFSGGRSEMDGDVVLASIQKLSRPEHLARLEQRRFDYVIVDEVHHAAARSYRSVLDRLEPRFLLGLTATPERADGADVAGLFDDNVAYRANLGEGIERGLLVPFSYFGLRDDIDYSKVSFRNQRFDPAELARAVDTDERMAKMFAAWQSHPGSRTLVFCSSIQHAEHARDFLISRGVRAAAVHSGPSSTPRERSLADFVTGHLDALCTVDLFNEGVDLPDVDRVVMLRPTESPIVFLQQLGRGLRTSPGKERLTILDFVGNHRVFLDRVRTLLSLGATPTDLRDFVENKAAALLPGGSELDIEIMAKDLLSSLLPERGKSEVERVYRDLRTSRGQRPTAGELYRRGYRPSTLRSAYGGWFDFVAKQGDLTESERRVLGVAGDLLRDLESSSPTRCFERVTMEALLECGGLFEPVPVRTLSEKCQSILARSPDLARDLKKIPPLADPRTADPRHFELYWRNGPIAAVTTGPGRRYFALVDDRLVSKIPCPAGEEETLGSLLSELLDYRLAMDRMRHRLEISGVSFVAKVVWNKRDPILKLPLRATNPELPQGDVDVALPSGERVRFRLMKEFCNVAHQAGSSRNILADLLRGWFGPSAGQPGTAFFVRFSRSPDAMWVEPENAEERVIVASEMQSLPAYPELRAAAGAASDPVELAPTPERVRLPISAKGDSLFAVRATGDSMNGGKRPIRDGDWVVMRFARGASAAEVDGKVALLQVPDGSGGFAYQIKRVAREGKGWTLRSDNPSHPSYEADSEIVVIAILVDVVSPENIGPRPGELLEEAQMSAAFGLREPVRTGRVDGHLFLCVEEKGMLTAPDRAVALGVDARPGETAFVLTRRPGASTWRYAGVGRFDASTRQWVFPAVDFETYRALGKDRVASRTLPAAALERARSVMASLLRSPGVGQTITMDEKQCRLVGPAKNGGIQIDGGPSGFGTRTITSTDIAWVLVARDDVAEKGGILDEERVNKLRYIDGTKKGSTRWIDSGWALLLVRAVERGGVDG